MQITINCTYPLNDRVHLVLTVLFSNTSHQKLALCQLLGLENPDIE
jgi:hypothetical protein